jgi:hypothetical protein
MPKSSCARTLGSLQASG